MGLRAASRRIANRIHRRIASFLTCRRASTCYRILTSPMTCASIPAAAALAGFVPPRAPVTIGMCLRWLPTLTARSPFLPKGVLERQFGGNVLCTQEQHLFRCTSGLARRMSPLALVVGSLLLDSTVQANACVRSFTNSEGMHSAYETAHQISTSGGGSVVEHPGSSSIHMSTL